MSETYPFSVDADRSTPLLIIRTIELSGIITLPVRALMQAFHFVGTYFEKLKQLENTF